jgi:hypothetical protein
MYAINMLETRKPKRERGTSVEVERSVYNRVKKLVSERGEIKKFVNQTVEMNIGRIEFLKKFHNPLLSLVHAHDQSILIQDNKIDKIIEVKLFHIGNDNDKEIMLKCVQDNSEGCVHVIYASALLEVGKLSINNRNG